MKNSKKYWLGLSMIKGLGPIRINNLLNYFKNPEAVWKAEEKALKKVSGINKTAKSIREQRKKIDLDSELEKLQKKNINLVTLEEKNYPEILKNIYDPPPVLFFKGKLNLELPGIAVVGSRRCTSYGRKVAKKLAHKLSARGLNIISGMARGIDTCSHMGALRDRGKTTAVLGSGLDHIYPPENENLFQEIQKQGSVISEFPLGVKPLSQNFPQRNRIISGLALGTVVIEASARSGSLITASLALEQGREVFAVPGNINRPSSKGTNNLIKKGAKIVTCVSDILEELFLYTEENIAEKENKKTINQEKINKNIYPSLTEAEEKIIKILQQEEKLHINKIIEKSNFKVSKVNSLLLKLELKGLVSKEEGKKYLFKGLQNLLKPV